MTSAEGRHETSPLLQRSHSPELSAEHSAIESSWSNARSQDLQTARQAKESSMRTAVLHALGAMWLFLVCGLLFYHFYEGWGVIDSLYFCIVVLTTVGYGDMAPSSDIAKLFTIIYVVVAVAIILAIASYLVELLVEANEQIMVKTLMIDAHTDSDVGFTVEEKNGIVNSLGSFLVVCTIGALFFCLVDGLSLVDALYFIVITSSTVGFGDLEPKTQLSRAFAIFFLVLSTLTLAKTLGEVTAARAAARQRDAARRTIHAAINRDVFAELDVDGDGEITRVEFLSAMLIKLGNVDRRTVEDILAEFDRRDADASGAITLGEAGLKSSKSSYIRHRLRLDALR